MVFKPLLTSREIRRIAADLRQAMRRAGITVDQLILFGSYAKGKPHPWSDIDLCVVSRQFGDNDYDDHVHVSRLAKQVNYLIEAHAMHPRELRNPQHPLAGEIRRAGKRL